MKYDLFIDQIDEIVNMMSKKGEMQGFNEKMFTIKDGCRKWG
jgi:hypothetical protein